MININNSVTNILGSPAFISCDFADLPQPYDVAIGTFAVYLFDGHKYFVQSNGTTWLSIDNGGGGTNPTSKYLPYNNAGIFLDSFIYNDDLNQELFTIYGDPKGLKLFLADNEFYFGWNESTQNNNNYFVDTVQCVIGDSNGNYNGIRLIVSDNNQIIRTSETGTIKGIDFRYNTEVYNFGTENYMLNVDAGNNQMGTWTNGVKYGLRITNTTTELGAYNTGGCGIGMDSTANNITLTATSNIYMGLPNLTQFTFGANKLTFNGANLIATGVHTATANHLKVTINGANYTIQLLTP